MGKTIKIVFIIIAVILLTLALAFIFREKVFPFFVRPTETFLETGVQLHTHGDGVYEEPHIVSQTTLEKGVTADPSINEENTIKIVAENLKIPWEIRFLPNMDMLVTERPGTLKRIGKEGNTYAIEGVEHIGESGLLGIALHPLFSENRWIYLYLTTDIGDGPINRVERYRFKDDILVDKTVIIDNIPGGWYHAGGRIAFGPDDYLYISVGDATTSENPQDIDSLAGKILRITDDGSIPESNPYNNAVYSYGHRNPQGLAWDDAGRLWATEHGGSSGFDELNLIKKGANYGWPEITGDETRDGMESPIAHSGRDETWAPTGMTYLNGSLFFGGLRGESLYEAEILNEETVLLKSHFRLDFGRIRAVVLGPDNYIYISTSNTDGRGKPKLNDDKIIRINPIIFNR